MNDNDTIQTPDVPVYPQVGARYPLFRGQPGAGVRRPGPRVDADALAAMTPDAIVWEALRVRGKGYTVPADVKRLLDATRDNFAAGHIESREDAILDLDNALQIRFLEPMAPANALGAALFYWAIRQVDTDALAARLLREGMPEPY